MIRRDLEITIKREIILYNSYTLHQPYKRKKKIYTRGKIYKWTKKYTHRYTKKDRDTKLQWL